MPKKSTKNNETVGEVEVTNDKAKKKLEKMAKVFNQHFGETEKLPSEMTNEELAESYQNLKYRFDELEDEKSVLSEELLLRVHDNGEVMGQYMVTKAKRLSFPDISIEQARDLGAVKEAKDEPTLKALYSKGVKLPAEPKVTYYILVKEIERKSE